MRFTFGRFTCGISRKFDYKQKMALKNFLASLLLLQIGLSTAQEYQYNRQFVVKPRKEAVEKPMYDPSRNAISDEVEPEDDLGYIDGIFGKGTQSRIVTSVNKWVTDKAKTNPGCVERFVCETYKTGETMNGIPYLLMQLVNAAVSFMVAEMFDQTIDIQEITRAARYGRTLGTCKAMECDVMDGQLRTLGDYLSSVEEFFTSIFETVSNSINLG